MKNPIPPYNQFVIYNCFKVYLNLMDRLPRKRKKLMKKFITEYDLKYDKP